MKHTDFQVNVAALRAGRAQQRDAEIEVPVAWAVELSEVLPDPPLRARLRLDAVSGGIEVRGTVVAAVRHRCYRCLAEIDDALELDVIQVVTADADGGDDYHLDGDVLDLEPLVRDEVMLAMPVAPVCGPDCPGLVGVPGSGLNTATPDQEDESTSPFAVLKDLLDTGD
ncbi:MAG: DUF177 domain-containing protein [Acidimicrobiia bacterium]